MSCEAKQDNIGFWGWIKRFFLLLIVVQLVVSFIPIGKKFFDEANHPKTKIAWIDIKGMITSSEDLLREIRWAKKDSSVAAVLLKIDSGGGAAATSELIYREMLKLKAKKPVVALVENICASGAYFIAAAADKILAQECSWIGSIGVFSVLPNFKKLLENANIDVDLVSRGEYKLVGNYLSTRMNEKEKKYMQKMIDNSYDAFVDKIVVSRGLSHLDQKRWAEGRVFDGRQALAEKLIDAIGDLDDAEQEIKSLLKLDDSAELKYLHRPKPSAFEKMLKPDGEDLPLTSHQNSFLQSFCKQLICSFCDVVGQHNFFV